MLLGITMNNLTTGQRNTGVGSGILYTNSSDGDDNRYGITLQDFTIIKVVIIHILDKLLGH